MVNGKQQRVVLDVDRRSLNGGFGVPMTNRTVVIIITY